VEDVEDDIDKLSIECATLVLEDLMLELVDVCGGGDNELNLGEE
jgi:hypothetical protein